jgi:hypothetical protein
MHPRLCSNIKRTCSSRVVTSKKAAQKSGLGLSSAHSGSGVGHPCHVRSEVVSTEIDFNLRLCDILVCRLYSPDGEVEALRIAPNEVAITQFLEARLNPESHTKIVSDPFP